MQQITPFLWFEDNAEAAAEFYTSVFDDSRVTSVARYTKAGPGREGTVMVITRWFTDDTRQSKVGVKPLWTISALPLEPVLEVTAMEDAENQEDGGWGRRTS